MRMRMGLLLVVMLVALFLLISGSHCRRSRADEAQARKKNSSSTTIIYKTIRTRNEDVFDCVDIYRQPSLDHPLLKTHKIQLNPTLNLEEKTTTRTSTSAKYAKTELQSSGGCPPGTVPIHRLKKTNTNTKEDFYPQYQTSIKPVVVPGTLDHWISLDPSDQGYFYGAKAEISLHNPSVAVDQFTTSQIWISSSYADKLDAIEVGWIVYPKLFNDNKTRLFGHWTSDGYKTGCFNTICNGFVQVDSTVALGDAFTQMSVYDGQEYVMVPMVSQDPQSGNWWLVLTQNTDVKVGYWPRELFYELANNATNIRFGGIAGAETNRPSPPMGNGHLPENNFKRSGYMSNMKQVDERGQFIDFDDFKSYVRRDIQNCYDMQYFGYVDKELEIAMLFGGPGGSC